MDELTAEEKRELAKQESLAAWRARGLVLGLILIVIGFSAFDWRLGLLSLGVFLFSGSLIGMIKG